MDGAYNFLEEWVRNDAQDIPNELLNLSDHSDYAMESTSDLMDWSSLFGADDSKDLFCDKKTNDASVGMEDFADLIDDNLTFAGMSAEKDIGPVMVQQVPLQNNQQPLLVPQAASTLQVQMPLQHVQTSQQNPSYQPQLFIQPQQPSVQQIQLSQQQLQQMLPSQQQHLHISFQAASSTPMFPQSQQIILQQSAPPVHAPQILLQQPQTPHAQVIISPHAHHFQTQQQICIPPTQKVQLVQHQQQQMLILNGSNSGSNFLSPSQIVLAPLQQTQQNPIIIQQPQVQQAMTNQTIMVQIGNQLFQLQTPTVEKNLNNMTTSANKVTSKNGLIRISAKHAQPRNSPLVSDSKPKFLASGLSITENSTNKLTSQSTSNSINKSLALSSFSAEIPSFLPKLITSISAPTTATTSSCVLPTPVAKVRPLECKSGGTVKVMNISNAPEFVNRTQEKMSALEKMTSIQRQSFNSIRRSVPELVQSSTASSASKTQVLSSNNLISSLAAALNSQIKSYSSPSNFSTKSLSSFSSAPTCMTSSVGLHSSSSSKQSQISKDFLKLSVGEKFKIHLMKDQKSALQPDTKSPFMQLRDALGALAPYHVFQTRTDNVPAVSKAKKLYEDMSQDLLEKKDQLLMKYQHIMLNRSMVHHDSVEDVMLGRMFLVQEMSTLREEKKLFQTDPDSFVPRPVLPPEEMAALYPKVKKDEHPDLDDDDNDDDDDDDDDASSKGSSCGYKEAPDETSPSRVLQDCIFLEETSNPEKHIVIKIRHCDGTFSASPARKRPNEDSKTSDKIPPIKIARIRLKRIDANEEEENNQKKFFKVVDSENSIKLKDSMNSSFKACNGTSNPNYSKHAVTAVVTPFHKHHESSNIMSTWGQRNIFSESKSLEPQTEMHPSFMDVATSNLPHPVLPKSDVTDENIYFGLLDENKAILGNGFEGYSPKQDDCSSFISSDGFALERCPFQLRNSTNNETQMFASDSEEFLDSNLEIEMQSAIQSILSHRTE